MEERPLDSWADWLLHGRQRGAPATHALKQTAHLERVRDRILDAAEIGLGDRVLDLGSGTGLLAHKALERVGTRGLVVALDLSADALIHSTLAVGDDARGGSLAPVVGSADQLPFPGGVFDVVIARSVIMYVEDRARAIAEVHRVLKQDGRVSICEAIMRVYENPGLAMPLDLPFEERHNAAIAFRNANAQYHRVMSSFDERDLLHEFIDAGFTSIHLTYEHHHDTSHRSARWEAQTYLSARTNPGEMSYEEASRAALGDNADEHLAQYFQHLVSHPVRVKWAMAYLAARR